MFYPEVDDVRKGQAVKAQLVCYKLWYFWLLTYIFQQLWDTLLDTRIRLQKSVVASNRFPAVGFYDVHRTGSHLRLAFSHKRISSIATLSERSHEIS